MNVLYWDIKLTLQIHSCKTNCSFKEPTAQWSQCLSAVAFVVIECQHRLAYKRYYTIEFPSLYDTPLSGKTLPRLLWHKSWKQQTSPVFVVMTNRNSSWFSKIGKKRSVIYSYFWWWYLIHIPYYTIWYCNFNLISTKCRLHSRAST